MPFNDKKGPLYIAVRAVVCADFEAASKRFYETLGGQDSWAPMEEAMWALQALHNVEIVNELEPVGVVQWTKTLAARHRTKREA